jgi:hypothetical protein
MNDREKATVMDPRRRLSDAIRDVKFAAAERDDVVVEMREAARMRLELLAQELEPVFGEVPDEEIQFDFVISSGLQPRLWIDAVSHVAMGRDRRTYRFVRDTRLGRSVLAESTEIKPVADQVTRYIAERMIERQRWLDGTVEGAAPAAVAEAAPARHEAPPSTPVPANNAGRPAAVAEAASAPSVRSRSGFSAFLSSLGIVLMGAAAGLAVLAAVYWERVAAYIAAM